MKTLFAANARRAKLFVVIAALALSLVAGGAATAGSAGGGPDLPCPHC